jgi:capping protein alpha
VYTPLENPTFTLEIVGNRFNPSNFWTGRWRTRWVVDRAARSVTGTIRVDVHYYEQGNVQLATEHRASFELPEGEGAALASAIVSSIARIETEYQLEIGDVYQGLGDKAFRALRRALPVTRQRVDWDKVSGYSIGSDLSKAFA